MMVRWAFALLAVGIAVACTGRTTSEPTHAGSNGGRSATGARGGASGRGGTSAQGGFSGGSDGGTGGCATPETNGVALAVAELTASELQAEGLAYFEYGERYTAVIERRNGGWLVGGYAGFWDVSDSGERVRVGAPDESDVFGFLAGDLDGDGNEDVVSIHERASDAVVAVWRRAEDGTLERRATMVGHSSEGPAEYYAVAMGDIDDDGDLDLVAFPGSLVLHRHDGNFGFEDIEGPHLPDGYGNSLALHLELYDADGDETIDLVGAFHEANTEESYAALFSGNGTGGFAEASLSAFGILLPSQVAGGRDFTGDGIFDLALLEAFSGEQNRLVIAAGDGRGAFEALEPREVDYFRIAVADVDGDGVADVIGSLGEELRMDRSLGNGAFDTDSVRVPPGSAHALAAVEVASGPAEVGLLTFLGCRAPCTAACAGECFAGQCLGCTASFQCGDGLCLSGTCDVCAPPCGGGGAGGAGGEAGLGGRQ